MGISRAARMISSTRPPAGATNGSWSDLNTDGRRSVQNPECAHVPRLSPTVMPMPLISIEPVRRPGPRPCVLEADLRVRAVAPRLDFRRATATQRDLGCRAERYPEPIGHLRQVRDEVGTVRRRLDRGRQRLISAASSVACLQSLGVLGHGLAGEILECAVASCSDGAPARRAAGWRRPRAREGVGEVRLADRRRISTVGLSSPRCSAAEPPDASADRTPRERRPGRFVLREPAQRLALAPSASARASADAHQQRRPRSCSSSSVLDSQRSTHSVL